MNLYLMRHGQAADAQVDPQRGLTEAGRADVERMAQRLVDKGIQFSQAYHSDKLRAKQTAEIVTQIVSPQVVPQIHRGLKPNDDPSLIAAKLQVENENTLIASHLPFVPGLVAELTGKFPESNIFPATVICLQRDKNSWTVDWIESTDQ